MDVYFFDLAEAVFGDGKAIPPRSGEQ